MYNRIKFKEIKRLGVKLWPQKSLTRTQKNIFLNKNLLRPFKKSNDSFFNRKLKERKKLSGFYGKLPLMQFKKTFSQLLHLHGNRSQNFFQVIESRLDVILFRIKFLPSLGLCRTIILSQKILVNGQPVPFPHFRCQSGDIISVHPCIFSYINQKLHYYIRTLLIYQNNHKFTPNSRHSKGESHPLFQLFQKDNNQLVNSQFSYNLPNDLIIRQKIESGLLNQRDSDYGQSELGHSKGTGSNNKTKFIHKYKLPHLEICYKTLTAIVLPFHFNKGYQPLFPQSLNYGIIRSV